MKSIKKLIFAFNLFLLSTALPAFAADPYGLEETTKGTGLKNVALPTVIGSIIGYALSFIGIIFMGLMLYGGYTWMTSFGNEQKVEKAKELIIGAVIGLIIVIAAYAITTFVVNALISSTTATPS